MSGLLTALRCETCCVTIATVAEHSFEYTSADSPAGTVDEKLSARDHAHQRPIFGELVWCHACNAPGHIERIPDSSEFEAVARILRNGGAHFDLDERREIEVDTRLLHFARNRGLDVLGEYAARLFNRVSKRRCLACGSSSFTPIEIVRDRVTSLRHDLCGGELSAQRFYPGPGHLSHPEFKPWTEVFHGWDGEFKWAIRYLAWTPDGHLHWEQDAVERFA